MYQNVFAPKSNIGPEWNAATAKNTTYVNSFFDDPITFLLGTMKSMENDPGMSFFVITWS